MRLTGRLNGRFNNRYFFLERCSVEPGWYYLHANYGDFELWGGHDLELIEGDSSERYKLVGSRDYSSFPSSEVVALQHPIYSTEDGKHFEFLRYTSLPNPNVDAAFDSFIKNDLLGI